MNKKLFIRIAAAFMSALMFGTVSFADASVSNSQITPDISNAAQKDDGYDAQASKTVVAFYAASEDAAEPASFDDIIILDEGSSIQESYTIDISKQKNDYIIILFSGSDGKTARSVITMEHTEHIWKSSWSHDTGYHWHDCSSGRCELADNSQKDSYGEHIPQSGSGNCSAAVTCSVCSYEIEAAADGHIYTDATDGACNNTGCLYTRTPAAVTVAYNVNGGQALGTTNTTGADGKLTAELAAPKRNGWTFGGWYTAANGGTKIDKSTTVFYEAATVYAHWTSLYQGGSTGGSSGGGGGVAAPATYTLSFETNGGTEVSSVKRAKNLTINLGSFATSKENYEFAGWCSDSELSEVISEVKLTGDMTIYAKWNEKAGDNEDNNEPEITRTAFSDVSSDDWFREAVEFVSEKGIMNCVSETEFAPHNTTTRAMLVTMLYRLEGEPAIVGDDAHIVPAFSDVRAGAYYEKAVIWAKEAGIVNGYENGSFGTDDAVSREQIASILYRYAAYKEYDTNYEDTNILSFDDAFEISEYAYPALQWSCKNGIINGDGSKLMPGAAAQRCQVAAMLMRFSAAAEK